MGQLTISVLINGITAKFNMGEITKEQYLKEIKKLNEKAVETGFFEKPLPQ